MKAHEAKVRIWNVEWNGHKIRLEYNKKGLSGNWCRMPPRFVLFFDGKFATISYEEANRIEAYAHDDNGVEYFIECMAGPKSMYEIQWPPKKSFWGRIDDLIEWVVDKDVAEITVNDDLIYLSHIGRADRIEWVRIQNDFNDLVKEERALEKGKEIGYAPKGIVRISASKERLEEIKIRLEKTRKELESKLSSWESKNEKPKENPENNQQPEPSWPVASGHSPNEGKCGWHHAQGHKKHLESSRDADNNLVTENQKRRIKDFLTTKLTRTERAITVLYYYEEMTIREIAAALDMTEARVSQIHSSIVARLKSDMKGITMAKIPYREFFNPTELTLKIVHGYGGTVSNAEMHFTTTTGGDVNIDILRPKLISDIHSDLTELSGDLTEIDQIQCFREPLADGTLRCRIEITRKDENREIIQCDDIEDLPA